VLEKISLSDEEYYDQVVVHINGWLERYAAMSTMWLLHHQETADLTGALLEIGVFCGRYLSILARSAAKTHSLVLAIDTFEYSDYEEISRLFSSYVGEVVFWKRRSDTCHSEEILECLGCRPRFVSVDGSHLKGDVYLDLVLTEQLCDETTIVAVDDFLNQGALGVNEACHLFFAQPRLLVPFAYLRNKLFLSHRAKADEYRQALETMILADEKAQEAQMFRERLQNGRHHVEQLLWGSKMLFI
jgi:hypothetical protein